MLQVEKVDFMGGGSCLSAQSLQPNLAPNLTPNPNLEQMRWLQGTALLPSFPFPFIFMLLALGSYRILFYFIYLFFIFFIFPLFYFSIFNAFILSLN